MNLAILDRMSLSAGSHGSIEAGACVMEIVAHVAGDPWSDSPPCACPIIAAFLRSWNDALPTNADRDRLLKPLVPFVVGTRSTPAIEQVLRWSVPCFCSKTSTTSPVLWITKTEGR